MDNFEKYLESYILITQNAYKSHRNQINNLSTLKKEVMNIFCGFRVFQYTLWLKIKTRKCRISTESFPNKKTLNTNGCHY